MEGYLYPGAITAGNAETAVQVIAESLHQVYA